MWLLFFFSECSETLVEEVKQSDEWKAVKMSILSIGVEHGKMLGKAESIMILLKNLGSIPEDIKTKILGQTEMDILDVWQEVKNGVLEHNFWNPGKYVKYKKTENYIFYEKK